MIYIKLDINENDPLVINHIQKTYNYSIFQQYDNNHYISEIVCWGIIIPKPKWATDKLNRIRSALAVAERSNK